MHGLAQFTPQQLLESGRRAEAEGRPDLAHQFYWHLAEQYGYTAEAADARNGLARVGNGGQMQNIWQPGSAHSQPSAASVRSASARVQRGRQVEPREAYRGGRALAAIAAGIGWLAIGAALTAVAVGTAAHVLPMPRDLKLTWDAFLLLAGAVPGGGALALAGQAARALFDQASAARELVAIERARRNGEPS